MGGYYFVSYSREDAGPFVDRLLESMAPDERLWVDRHEISAGSLDWDDQIQTAIRECQGLLFVLSRDAVAVGSECKGEWTRALHYRKPVVLVSLHSDALAPMRLGGRQVLDFSEDFGAGLAALRRHLAWRRRPEGALDHLQWLHSLAERDLRRTLPASDQSLRAEEEVARLSTEIASLKDLIADPQGATQRTNESIRARIEGQRRPAREAAKRPQLRAINPPPGDVPTHFQDRYAESRLLGRFLGEGSTRIVTVVGRSGVGKTALVCRLLDHLERGSLPDDGGEMAVDGVVYLSGAGSRRLDAATIFADLARLLPVDEAERLDEIFRSASVSLDTKIRKLLAQFTRGRVVLLLDNFEDALDPVTRTVRDPDLAQVFVALLEAPPHSVHTIVTTRVAPTDVLSIQPGRQRFLALDDGLPAPFASALLRDLDADGRLGLRDAPEDILAEASRRTQGNPRALEALYAILAADRSATLADVLEDTQRVLPAHVLDVLIGEAFHRLDSTAQRVVQATAVFERPVPPVGVDYLLQPVLGVVDAAPVLRRLHNLQLVRRETKTDCYYLHPVDRSYALSSIPTSPQDLRSATVVPAFDLDTLRDRAADYYVQTRRPRTDWQTLDDAIPQIAEIEMRVARGDFDTAASVLKSFSFEFLYAHGYYSTMAALHERFRGRIKNPDLARSISGNLGHALRVLGRVRDAAGAYEEAIESARRFHDLWGEAVWLGNLGDCLQDLGRSADALRRNEEALAGLGRVGTEWDAATVYGRMASCHADLGNLDSAVELNLKALRLMNQRGDEKMVGLLLANLAEALIEADRIAEAETRALQGVEIGQRLGDPMIGVYNNKALAVAAMRTGNRDAALRYAQVARSFDVPEIRATCEAILGVSLLDADRLDAARNAFRAALAQAGEILKLTPDYYIALEAAGLAHAGLAALHEDNELRRAIVCFQQARAVTSNAGVVSRIVHLIDALVSASPPGSLVGVRDAAAGTPGAAGS